MMDELDQKLKTGLKGATPSPRPAARRQARDLAMAAFDEESAKKNETSPQGSGAGERPNVIFNMMRGLFAMENRTTVTAAMTGLLLLPLGYVLYTNTALTPVQQTIANRPISVTDESVIRDGVDERRELVQESVVAASGGASDGEMDGDFASDISAIAEPEPMEAPIVEPGLIVAQPHSENLGRMQNVSPQPTDDFAVAEEALAGGYMSNSNSKTIAESAIEVPRHVVTEQSGDQFTQFDDANIKSVTTDPVSTFSIDVDTASYSYVRKALNEGWVPDAGAVRVEEMVNYFDYDYAVPTDPNQPFATNITIAPSPWDAGKQIMRIGVQGYDVAAEDRPPANLVFLIDTSGSMNEPDKLPLLIKSFSLMLDALKEGDTVGIVTYAGSAGVVLDPTDVSEKRKILDALQNLSAGGSTAGAEGIEAAYKLAQDAAIEGGTNQVILATDGDFNVGLSDPAALTDFIADKRDEGVFLSVLGFGTGNLNDAVMQALAQNGNGTAHYIDGLREAQSVLVHDVTATLLPIAKDVKIQVEFNPAQVAEYRLIGYETRSLNREDFNNDRVDAGEVGAGASVTAIYEITPVGSPSILLEPLRYGDNDNVVASDDGELGYFKLRYKLPDEDTSHLIEVPITQDLVVNSLEAADDDMRFAIAVAAFGQKLRDNSFVDQVSYDEIKLLAAGARGTDPDGFRSEFLSLVDLAKILTR